MVYNFFIKNKFCYYFIGRKKNEITFTNLKIHSVWENNNNKKKKKKKKKKKMRFYIIAYCLFYYKMLQRLLACKRNMHNFINLAYHCLKN
jgi:hypothetical protein